MKTPTHDEERERAEKERAEQAERERTDKERADKERADKERADKERADKERADKERADKPQATRPGQSAYGAGVAGRAGAGAQTAPDPYKTYTLADFANEFLANLPAGAAGGTYVATEGDMWSDPAAHPWTIDSGNHDSHGWRFTFRDGRFVEARRFVDDAGTAPAGAARPGGDD